MPLGRRHRDPDAIGEKPRIGKPRTRAVIGTSHRFSCVAPCRPRADQPVRVKSGLRRSPNAAMPSRAAAAHALAPKAR